MRKALVVLLCAMSYAGAAWCRAEHSLYDMFSRQSVVKVYVGDVTDSTGKEKVKSDDLRKKLGEALAARRSIRFQTVPERREADVAIDVEVVEFFWSETDPVDMIMGVGMTAMDAIKQDHYARMQAFFTVTDAKKQSVLWKEKVLSTVTDAKMTEEESPLKINADIVKTFIRDCFGRKRA